MSPTTPIEKVQRLLQEKENELLRCGQLLAQGALEHKRAKKEILATALKEQKRFGLQLHDGLCQELTGILMLAKGLTQKMEKEDHLNSNELKRISNLINEAVRQARDTARGLYPGELDGGSLTHMLEELISGTQISSGISCQFHCPNPIVISKNDVANYLYKIAREGVDNAVKHGKAKSIEVRLTQTDGNTVLTIKDDGAGFVGDLQKTKGIGLKLTHYRSQVMDASFQVESNIPHGVILRCSLPKGSL